MKKSEATGLVVNPRAIATRCETSFLSRAPQRCGGQSTGLTHCVVAPDERFTDGLKVGAEARRSACFETSAEANNQGHVDKESTSHAKYEPYGMLQSLNQSIISD